MGKQLRILIIVPKINKTEIAVFLHHTCIYKHILEHEHSYIDATFLMEKEAMYRKKEIMNNLHEAGINVSKIKAVSSIGGMLKPVEGGTYLVNEQMLVHLRSNYNGKHISNLGAIVASAIATELNINAYVVDPPVVNEFKKVASYTGIPTIKRQSIFHALNQKAVARMAAKELNTSYKDINIIVGHLGYGTTIGAHKRGKVIDVNNGLYNDGPFSIERAGTIPVNHLLDLAYANNYTKEQLKHKLVYESGLKAYLRENNFENIKQKIENSSEETIMIIEGLVYQVVKEIGAMAAALNGDIQAIVLTGPLASVHLITELIIEKTSWIADLFVYPGEHDIQALHEGTLRVLVGDEKVKYYS